VHEELEHSLEVCHIPPLDEDSPCPLPDPSTPLPSARYAITNFTQMNLVSYRQISSDLHSSSNDVDDSILSHMFTQFGQFLDHDVVLTPESELAEDCCKDSSGNNNPYGRLIIFFGQHGQEPQEPGKEECFPIEIPSDDPFFSPLGEVHCH